MVGSEPLATAGTSRRQPSEPDLIAAAKGGDSDAYGELIARHERVALRTAYALGAAADAEDVTQDAFVAAWLALPRFRDGSSFRPWIVKIVTNEVRNRQRTWRRREGIVTRSAHLLISDDATSGEDVAMRGFENRIIRDAVARLPDRQRLVVTYRYLLDLSEAETAEALGWPKGSVKSRLSRALNKLESDPAVRHLLGGEL